MAKNYLNEADKLNNVNNGQIIKQQSSLKMQLIDYLKFLVNFFMASSFITTVIITVVLLVTLIVKLIFFCLDWIFRSG